MNGKSPVKYVGNIKNALKNFGIFQEDGLLVRYVKNVLLKNQLKLENYLLQKDGSVKITQKSTKIILK